MADSNNSGQFGNSYDTEERDDEHANQRRCNAKS